MLSVSSEPRFVLDVFGVLVREVLVAEPDLAQHLQLGLDHRPHLVISGT